MVLLKLKEKLKRMWNVVMEQEELLWLQKSKVQWLNYGDRNTRLFHTSTLVRRRKTLNGSLQDGNGKWVEDSSELKEMARQYYSDLYTANPESGGVFTSRSFRDHSVEAKTMHSADFF